ncbi:MAG: ABC transporter permease [Thermoproteota archaeon]
MGEIYETLQKSSTIALNDIKLYYFKPPSIFFGIMLPLVLYFAFTLGRPCVTEAYRLTGVVAVSIFFGASTLEAVVLPIERKTGTFERLVSTPLSLEALILGKMASGAIFGTILGVVMATILILVGPAWRWAGLSDGLSLSPIPFLLTIIISAINSSSLGLLLSVRASDVADAMMPLNFLRFVMIFLSGVFIPLEETFLFNPSLTFLAYLLPLTYSVEALRQTTYGPLDMQRLLVDFTVLILSSTILTLTAIKLLKCTLRSRPRNRFAIPSWRRLDYGNNDYSQSEVGKSCRKK